MLITNGKTSNRPPKQTKIDMFFCARKQVDSAEIEDDVEVLQPPNTSTAERVVLESDEEYVLSKTIDLCSRNSRTDDRCRKI